MTVAAVTKATQFNTQQVMPVWLCCYKAAATVMIDTTQLTPAFRGFMPLNGFAFSTSACVAQPLMQHGVGKVTTTTTAVATTLSVEAITQYVAAYARTPPYYILAQDATTSAFEIMLVTADSLPEAAATDLTVVRGCLGTTAGVAGVTDESFIYFLNILYLSDATSIGTMLCYGVPFPNDERSKIFKVSPR